jgi:hypothetical protein
VLARHWNCSLGKPETHGFYVGQRVKTDLTSIRRRTLQALKSAMTKAGDIEVLFSVWEQNLDTVRALNKCVNREGNGTGPAQQLVTHLKQCAINFVRSLDGNERPVKTHEQTLQRSTRPS